METIFIYLSVLWWARLSWVTGGPLTRECNIVLRTIDKPLVKKTSDKTDFWTDTFTLRIDIKHTGRTCGTSEQVHSAPQTWSQFPLFSCHSSHSHSVKEVAMCLTRLHTLSHSSPLWSNEWMSSLNNVPWVFSVKKKNQTSDYLSFSQVWQCLCDTVTAPSLYGRPEQLEFLTSSCCPGWPASRPTMTGVVSGRAWWEGACCGRRWTGCAPTLVRAPHLIMNTHIMWQQPHLLNSVC